MKSKFLFSCSSMIYFFISLVRFTLTIPNNPLIYDPFSLQVYNVDSDSPDTWVSYPFAIACPAQDESETLFNDNESFDHKALFVRQYHGRQKVPLLHIESCPESIQLSAVFVRGKKYDKIKFGYEVYDEDRLPSNTYESRYRSYGRVSGAGSIKKHMINAIIRGEYPVLRSSKVSFIWITQFMTRYHYKTWHIIQVRYEIYRNAVQINENCDNYNLAKEFYQKKNLDDFYSPENQEKVFSSVTLPELYSGDPLHSIYKYVKKYHLLFPYNFQPTPSSPVSCSNLTTTPIWYRKAEALLNYLEHFLIAIGEITKTPLKIRTSVNDVITLPSTDKKKYKLVPMYLYPEQKKIPIPRIIHKLISYQSYDCDSDQDLCWFDIAIIIHNHPYLTKKHEFCQKDRCKEWGWDSIQYMNTAKEGEKSEHIYCCRFDERTQKKLNFQAVKQITGDFNLKEFPSYKRAIDDHEYTDRQKEFEEQMDELISKSKYFNNLNQKSESDSLSPSVD